MKVNEGLFFLRAEIKNLQLVLANVDSKEGITCINLATYITNDIRSELDSLRLAWLAEHESEDDE